MLSLVTGGAGFVGRHLIETLLKRGDEVICVDSLERGTGAIDPESGWPSFEPRDFATFKFVREDCRDWFARNTQAKVDYAFHLAAVVGGRMMIEKQPLIVAVDLAIDALFWRWAEFARPTKIACFSSSAAYPIHLQRQNGYRLLKEDDISFTQSLGVPDLTYGWSKLTTEYLARIAFERHELRSVCFRPFSGYGPDQDLAYPFPSICKRALEQKGQPRLEVWGSGKQMRDFIHIRDCIDGIMTMVDRIDDGSAVNLSTGILTSFIELAEVAAASVGYKPEIVGTSTRPEGVFARGGDVSLQRKLGFSPSISLKQGVAETIEMMSLRSTR
jgi:nucleoside-diphosphate-sugar epimerase